MDRFQSLQVFVKVADCGGFAAAARDLNMSPPAVTRAVAMLEDRLGTRLFIRTTRSVRLSESGERFLKDGRRILQELDEAEKAAIGTHITPRGELRVTAPVLFGRMFVTPILGDFLSRYPEVSAQTLFVDRVVNLMDEGLDVAIRIGDLPDSSLTAVKAGEVRRVLFASPEYIGLHGLPKHPTDLSCHQLIQASTMGNSFEWSFNDEGKSLSLKIAPRLRMNTNDGVIEAVLRGGGISRLLSYQVMPDLNAGKLKIILSEFELPPLPIHVVHNEGRLVSAKVRSFVDHMVDRLRSDPILN